MCKTEPRPGYEQDPEFVLISPPPTRPTDDVPVATATDDEDANWRALEDLNRGNS